MAAIMTE